MRIYAFDYVTTAWPMFNRLLRPMKILILGKYVCRLQAKCIPIFIRENSTKCPILWGGTKVYSLYGGVPPTPGLIGHTISRFRVVKYMRFRVSGAQVSEQLFLSVSGGIMMWLKVQHSFVNFFGLRGAYYWARFDVAWQKGWVARFNSALDNSLLIVWVLKLALVGARLSTDLRQPPLIKARWYCF